MLAIPNDEFTANASGAVEVIKLSLVATAAIGTTRTAEDAERKAPQGDMTEGSHKGRIEDLKRDVGVSTTLPCEVVGQRSMLLLDAIFTGEPLFP